MNGPLGILQAPRRAGTESFHRDAEPLPFSLQDFWAWSVSDLVSNATRGRLAEYLVARAVGISTAGVRNEWAAYDLETPAGTKIEVKSAAFLQAWHQRKLSSIVFSTRLSHAWNPATGEMSPEIARQADLYVFALLHHLDKATLDPLNVAQWSFFVVPSSVLASRPRSQHSITLNSLERLTRSLCFEDLGAAVEAASRGLTAR